MSKKDKHPFINFAYDRPYIGFIKAMASRNVDLCWKFADQLRQYDTKANEAVKVLEDWININREKKKVDGELYDLKIKAKNLQEQNTRLTYLKSPVLNKKQSQIASIVQFLDLLTKKKYYKLINTSNPAHKEMAKNLWEYDCLKIYADKYRSQIGKIEEPSVQSQQFYHIKNLITVKKDEIDTVHRQYTQALRGILNFNSGKRQFKSITKQNMLLMQNLERRLTNKQIQIRNNYEQFSVKECQNSIKEEEFERFSCEIQENRKARIYQSQPTNMQEQKPKKNLQMQWNKLEQIRKLLDKVQGRNSIKYVDKTDYLNSVSIVLNDVSKCLKSLPQIKKPNNPLAQTQPVPQQHNTDSYEYWERKAIIGSLQDRIKQMQNRQKQIKQKIVKINKIIFQVELDESIPLWIDEYTQEDEIIENTIKNAQILVKQFNLTKEYLVEARKHANSVIMVQSEPQPQSEPDTLEVIEKVQENNFQGQQLVHVQDYIQKIQLLEEINTNLTKENRQFVEQIVRIKNKMENTERALEQLKYDKSYLEEQKKKLNTEINKLRTKSKATESPQNLFDLLASQIQMQKNILKQKIIEELQKQIETMKQQHKEETKELQNTIEQLTREVIDQKLKLERIELDNKDLLNQKKQQKGKLIQLQEELIKISDERNYLFQELNELRQNEDVQDQQRRNLSRVLKKIHSLGVKSSLESEKQ